jgi:hypothetical protein
MDVCSQLTSKLAAISIGIYRMPLQLLRNQQTSDSSHLSDKKKILAEFIEENGIDDVIDEMLSGICPAPNSNTTSNAININPVVYCLHTYHNIIRAKK